jgi:hypothetical protein
MYRIAHHQFGWQRTVKWYEFGHKLDAEIDSRVKAAFGENGLDETLLTKCPYTLCSVEEFERFMPLVAAKGVKAVMDEKVTPKRRLWLLHSALMEAFPGGVPRDTRRSIPGRTERDHWRIGGANIWREPLNSRLVHVRPKTAEFCPIFRRRNWNRFWNRELPGAGTVG